MSTKQLGRDRQRRHLKRLKKLKDNRIQRKHNFKDDIQPIMLATKLSHRYHATTPPKANSKIRRLIKEISEGEVYRLTPVPRLGCLTQRCYPNVLAAVEQDGGRPVYGWMVFYLGNKMGLEFVPHAIWENASGDKIDITPEQTGEPTVLFVEDDSWEWKTGLGTKSVVMSFPNKLSHEQLEYHAAINGIHYTKEDWVYSFNEMLKLRQLVIDANNGIEPKQFSFRNFNLNWKSANHYNGCDKNEKKKFIDMILNTTIEDLNPDTIIQQYNYK